MMKQSIVPYLRLEKYQLSFPVRKGFWRKTRRAGVPVKSDGSYLPGKTARLRPGLKSVDATLDFPPVRKKSGAPTNQAKP